MLALIAFCVLFLLCATAASGTAKLFMILIQPGELLGSWQNVLQRIEPDRGDRHYHWREFWYKRLGGCVICLRQFVAELSFIVFCWLYSIYGTFPTILVDITLLRWLLNFILFVGYCGVTLQIGQWMEYEQKPVNREDEKIIETRYRNN